MFVNVSDYFKHNKLKYKFVSFYKKKKFKINFFSFFENNITKNNDKKINLIKRYKKILYEKTLNLAIMKDYIKLSSFIQQLVYSYIIMFIEKFDFLIETLINSFYKFSRNFSKFLLNFSIKFLIEDVTEQQQQVIRQNINNINIIHYCFKLFNLKLKFNKKYKFLKKIFNKIKNKKKYKRTILIDNQISKINYLRDEIQHIIKHIIKKDNLINLKKITENIFMALIEFKRIKNIQKIDVIQKYMLKSELKKDFKKVFKVKFKNIVNNIKFNLNLKKQNIKKNIIYQKKNIKKLLFNNFKYKKKINIKFLIKKFKYIQTLFKFKKYKISFKIYHKKELFKVLKKKKKTYIKNVIKIKKKKIKCFTNKTIFFKNLNKKLTKKTIINLIILIKLFLLYKKQQKKIKIKNIIKRIRTFWTQKSFKYVKQIKILQ